MDSIPTTRLNHSEAAREKEKRRCDDIYVLVKKQQKRIEGQYRDVYVENTVFALASSHFRTGIILRRLNLFQLAIEHFDRALQLLVMF